jgi:DNA-binding GntR family transcriptional regulator
MSGTAERVYAFIRDDIVRGRHAAGAHLREVEIAAALGTSRTPVREALLQLEAEGLVVLSRNSGANVRAYSLDDAREIYWMRSMLEGRAAARAAARITAADIKALAALCDAMEAGAQGEEVDLVAFGADNARFHLIIAEASSSPVLAAQIRELVRLPITLFRDATWAHQLSGAAGYQQHREIVRALASHNPAWAQAQMQAHILAASPRAAADEGSGPQSDQGGQRGSPGPVIAHSS